MGTPGKWLKSLINLKKAPTSDQEKVGDKSKKKWKLWRSSSEGFGSSSKGGMNRSQVAAAEPLNSLDDALAAAMATLVRTQPKNFIVIKKEWAAIRIQAVFRGFLARQALRALRAVVRLQAIFRGRQVRKQAAVTLRCMQALARVQARARAQRTSPEGQESVQNSLDEHCYQADPIKQAEQGWCDSPGTVSEVRAKLEMRQRANIKRERAIAYSFSQQRSRSNASPYCRTSKTAKAVRHQKVDDNNSGWSWLEKWMAAKPWENRLMEEIQSVPSAVTPCSRKSGDGIVGFYPYSSEQNSVKVRRNNVSTRVSARPPTANPITRSSSAPSSDFLQDESSASTSCTSASPTLVFSNNLKVENGDETNLCKPSYMSLTKSTKAKQRTSNCFDMQRFSMEEYHYHNKSMGLSKGDTRSNCGSDLYPPISVGRVQRGRYQ
ncbi:PREDICTED: IQ-DOMAIN [Prunus dulcis]|uniref:PREDICTED: IQ-DOMAIN n=1 Tax=Prunus dulcis TaxID=3755 RepID=A0A5E4F7K8_PRUDU|nr:protein IQ-DOMAIN 1-like [Prunus dulcis]VVA24033.1 PREDICTED: IQ-DOMAIN [Prunus dulcis]